MFTALTVPSVHGMMINGLLRVYKSASFILSAMGAISRQRDALPTACKQLPHHSPPRAATQTGHWGAEVVCWADCCFWERGNQEEETEVRRPSGIWARAGSSFGKLLCFFIVRHYAAQHNLLLCQLPWGRGAMRCYTGRWYQRACFLPQKCAGPYKHSKDTLFSRELCFPQTA